MTTRQKQIEQRNFLERLRASPFLTELRSNTLAMVGLSIISTIVIISIYSRVFINLNAITATNFGANPSLTPPSLDNPFGTDQQARDIFQRTLYGAWIAMKYGTATVLASTTLGILLGVVAAYYHDIVDNAIMRVMDMLLAFPSLLLALAIVAIFGSGLWKAVLALTIVFTPRFARVVRGAALNVMEEDYVDAAVSTGASNPWVILRYVLPNCIAPILVQSSLNYGLIIINLAALSFLGFGASTGTPSWGMMLSNGTEYGLLVGIWWWSFFPGLFLSLTVLGFNLLGDGMRDALDPRMRETVD